MIFTNVLCLVRGNRHYLCLLGRLLEISRSLLRLYEDGVIYGLGVLS